MDLRPNPNLFVNCQDPKDVTERGGYACLPVCYGCFLYGTASNEEIVI